MYEVRATKLENTEGNVVGLASMVVDGKFAFNSIKIIRSNDETQGLFVSMPSYKSKSGEYVDFFHPTTQEMYSGVREAVLLAYNSGQTVTLGKEETNIKTYVEVHSHENSSLKARVKMFFDKDFVCDTIQVREDGREGNEGNLFVAMPSYQSKDGTFKNYCNPVSSEFYAELNNDIMGKYEIAATKEAEKYSIGVKPEAVPQETMFNNTARNNNAGAPVAPKVQKEPKAPSVPKPTSR